MALQFATSGSCLSKFYKLLCSRIQCITFFLRVFNSFDYQVPKRNNSHIFCPKHQILLLASQSSEQHQGKSYHSSEFLNPSLKLTKTNRIEAYDAAYSAWNMYLIKCKLYTARSPNVTAAVDKCIHNCVVQCCQTFFAFNVKFQINISN